MCIRDRRDAYRQMATAKKFDVFGWWCEWYFLRSERIKNDQEVQLKMYLKKF